jgi:hypothetical protein
MTTFDDRKNAFEEKYAHDEQMHFRAEARACKLFGLWLAEQFELEGSDAEAYARDIIGANLEEAGFDDVKRFVMPDIKEKGLDITEQMIERKLNEFMDQAKVQIMAEQAA